MRESDTKTALIPVQSTALSKVGRSLVARGRADLRIKEEAEECLKRGVELRDQGSYEEAFACFDRGIQLDPNHPELQHRLGSMYYFGQGVSRDYAQAEAWYRKAADQGHASAQFYLGVLYDLGPGVPQDYVQMAVWNRKAAEQGFAEAQYELGIMYRIGGGVPQDYAEAAVWYRKAAEQGNSRAQMNLGLLYYNGQGVPQDCAEAAVWFRKAAEQGYAGAQNNLGCLLYYNGQSVPQDYVQAAIWFRKAAENGYEPARAALATLWMVQMPEPSNPKGPTANPSGSIQKLSGEQKDAVLNDLKAEMEQGLLSPSMKPSFLGIDPDWFVCSHHTFEGNPLPEFCSISRNILDCFATALLSAPDLEFPTNPLVMRCRLGEDRKTLMLYLTAMLAVGEQMGLLELKEESEVWIGSNLRSLAEVKGITLGSTFWDRNGQHSFFFDYPGKMVRDKVPGLGAAGGDGKPRWPECELLLDSVPVTLREEARRTIHFVQSTSQPPRGSIQ